MNKYKVKALRMLIKTRRWANTKRGERIIVSVLTSIMVLCTIDALVLTYALLF